ncbi:cyclic peptide export ABC transporter [Marinobacter sp. NFXS9]|uniref:cyclic peptide export ABC transporter n=1 Tax=Marinobacter sp. NFXS9 TaxID=2818433 RepID=UPI0032E02502
MFKSLMFRFRWLIALAAALSALSALAGLAMLTMITDIISSFEKGQYSLTYPFSIFIIAVGMVLILGIASQYILIKLSSTVVYEIQQNLLKRILSSSYENIERVGGHRIIAALERDVGALANGLLAIPTLTFSSITLLLGVAYLVYISPSLFLLVLVAMIALIVLASCLLRYARKHQEVLREHIDSFYSNMQVLTNGGKEIGVNSYRRKHFFSDVMLPLFDRIRLRTVKSQLLIISLENFSTTLVYFLIGVVVYAAQFVLDGVDSSIIVTFVLVVLYMVTPLTQLVGMGEQVIAVPVSLRKVASLELAAASNFSLAVGKSESAEWNRLVIKNIQYRYKGNVEYSFSVGPVSAEINSGEVVFVTGGNGSGKSTFIKMLVGLYMPDSGDVYVDGVHVGKELALTSYMQNISVIFSDFFVFEQVLDSNGDHADDRDVASHLRKLKLNGKLTSLDGKLSSVNLSMGQKKRLALLQSYMEDARICVFDELASDQDPGFKRYFYRELIPELKKAGKFVVVVSHDENYFSTADQILHFRDGQLCQFADGCEGAGAV